MMVRGTYNARVSSSRVPLPFVVAIPIPRIDRTGRRVPATRVTQWKERALLVLGDCFGGAIATRSPGPYRHQDGTSVFDRDQWVVQAGCASREVYLRHRARIEAFAEEMGTQLRQEAVFVLACGFGESVLLFLDQNESTT